MPLYIINLADMFLSKTVCIVNHISIYAPWNLTLSFDLSAVDASLLQLCHVKPSREQIRGMLTQSHYANLSNEHKNGG